MGSTPYLFRKVKLSGIVSSPCIGEKTSMGKTRKSSGRKDGKTKHSVQGEQMSFFRYSLAAAPPDMLAKIMIPTCLLILHRWGYLPFNGGPRACLGQQFALTELAYTTVRLLEEFETLESRDDSPWQEKWMTSVSVKTGCQVSLIPNGGVVSG